jgi:hypothetical protein
MKWWHEAIIDDMLAFPLDTLKQRAGRLKYTESYLSIITNSDMFKAFYEERRLMFNAQLDASLQHKAASAANRALDIVLETLEKKRDRIPFRELAEFTDKTLERLGYGVKPGAHVNVQVNNSPSLQITKEQLAEARRDLRTVEDQRERVLEQRPLSAAPSIPEVSLSKPLDVVVEEGSVEPDTPRDRKDGGDSIEDVA